MDDRYMRLWILFKEKVARRAKAAENFSTEQRLYNDFLAELAILEAEVILED